MIAKVVLCIFWWAGFNTYLVASVAPPHRQKRQLIVHAGGHARSVYEADAVQKSDALYDGVDNQNQIHSPSRTEYSRGVVCPTWLHLDIQSVNLKPYLRCAGVLPAPFMVALYRSCHSGASTDANYTGTWDDLVPHKNDLRVLSDLAVWVQEQKKTRSMVTVPWEQFSRNLGLNGPTTAELVQSVLTHPSLIPGTDTMRILDFGCGTGTDLASLQSALHTASLNTICVDIVPVQKDGVYSMLLDGSSDFAYNKSLQAASVGLESTIHVVVCIFALHHISRPQMRLDALKFIAKVLQPGGVFLLSEWDDSLKPSRQIHYDLVHGVLPTLLFQGVAPNHLSEFNMNTTRYLSVAGWIDLVQSVHLTYDANRSQTWPGLLDPKAAANQAGNANREFHIVFRK